MAKKPRGTDVFSHWYHMIDGLQASPMEFYASVEAAIQKRSVPDLRISRVDWREGGVFSAKREYLRVQRYEYVFDVCGAPFANGFFVSWWLGELTGCLGFILLIPFFGPVFTRLFRPATYYRIDTALMFQESIHGSVLEVVDSMTSAKGIRALSELERKPILRRVYGR